MRRSVLVVLVWPGSGSQQGPQRAPVRPGTRLLRLTPAAGLDAYSVIFTNPCWTSWVVLAMASVLTLIPGSRSSFP